MKNLQNKVSFSLLNAQTLLVKRNVIASYSHLQKCCNDFLENLQPNVNNLSEMDSYFVLCEYYAYVSRKAKSYKGAFYAYKFMIRPLRDIIESDSTCNYYYAAYAANAKLALGSVQMDKMVLNDACKAIDNIYIYIIQV